MTLRMLEFASSSQPPCGRSKKGFVCPRDRNHDSKGINMKRELSHLNPVERLAAKSLTE